MIKLIGNAMVVTLIGRDVLFLSCCLLVRQSNKLTEVMEAIKLRTMLEPKPQLVISVDKVVFIYLRNLFKLGDTKYK